MHPQNAAESFFRPITTYFTDLLQTYPISMQKLNFFSLLCSIILALILSDSSYFAGLLVVIGLFFLSGFVLALNTFQKKTTHSMSFFFCEIILLVGLSLHNSDLALILPIAILTLAGFILIPYLEKQMNWTFYHLDFATSNLLFMFALTLHISVFLLFFYLVFFNTQILLKWFRSAQE